MCCNKTQAGVIQETIYEASMCTSKNSVVQSTEYKETAWRETVFLRSATRWWQNTSDLSSFTPRYIGSNRLKQVYWVVNFQLRLASCLLKWKTAATIFEWLSFFLQTWSLKKEWNFLQVWRKSEIVIMSWVEVIFKSFQQCRITH